MRRPGPVHADAGALAWRARRRGTSDRGLDGRPRCPESPWSMALNDLLGLYVHSRSALVPGSCSWQRALLRW